DHLHADFHVHRDRGDEQQHDDGDRGRAENLRHGGLIAAEQHDDDDHRGDGQRNVGDCGEPLVPEVLGARAGGAAAAHAGERRAVWLGGACPHPAPAMASSTTTQRTTVTVIEPTKWAAASHSRSFGPKPRPASQIRWRMPPNMWWITDHV